MDDLQIMTDSTAALIEPEEDLVSTSLSALRVKMRELVSSGVRQLTLDLTNVHMVDSAGLGLLIAAHNSLKKQGGEFAVVNASPDVLDLLKTMRIHQHFSVSAK